MPEEPSRHHPDGFRDGPIQGRSTYPARDRGPSTVADWLARLFGRLREILELIESVRADMELGSPAEGAAGCWADDDYAYIEADLPATGTSQVDICVVEGRVLIRASSHDDPERA